MFRNACNLFGNFLDGPKHKFVYRLRWVLAHFPIKVNFINDGKLLEISNYLGEKIMLTVNMLSRCLYGKDDWSRLISTPNRYGEEIADPF